jgi:L-type amino acid transporter 9
MSANGETSVPQASRASETQPLLQRPKFTAPNDTQPLAKQLTTRHAFAVLVTSQIGSGIFASPAQVDSNVPSPGAALLVWVAGGLLSWAGAASFAELGAALPLNGGMQEYLRHVYGDTAAFLMAWIYIVAVKPSSIAIQSIVIASSVGSLGFIDVSGSNGPMLLKTIAASATILMVLLNSISTRFTMRMSESFTVFKIGTVILIALAGLTAVIAHLVNPHSSLLGSSDWYSKNWFDTRPTVSDGKKIDWVAMAAWDRFGHYCAAIYGGLWAYDGWDNVRLCQTILAQTPLLHLQKRQD